MRFNFNGLAWVFSIPPSSKCSMILRWETLQCTAPYNVQGPPSISSKENSSLRNTIHNSINPAPLCLCEQTKTKIKLNSNLLFQVLLKLSVILPNWIKGEECCWCKERESCLLKSLLDKYILSFPIGQNWLPGWGPRYLFRGDMWKSRIRWHILWQNCRFWAKHPNYFGSDHKFWY